MSYFTKFAKLLTRVLFGKKIKTKWRKKPINLFFVSSGRLLATFTQFHRPNADGADEYDLYTHMRFSIGTGMYRYTEWPNFEFGTKEADCEELEGIELYDLEGGGSGRENKSGLG